MNSSKESDATVYQKSFSQLFSDAVWFSCEGERMQEEGESSERHRQRFFRSAILNSALAIECAANCCLEASGFDEETYHDLERSKTFAKFDLFLMSRANRSKLDRKGVLVKPVADLLDLRNSYVHPKVRSGTGTVEDNGAAFTNPKVPMNQWESVGIPRNSAAWRAADAKRVVICTSDFLNHLFFNLCNFDDSMPGHRQAVAQILSTEIIESDTPAELSYLVGRQQVLEDADPTLTLAMKKWDLDFAFLGSYWHDKEGNLVHPKRKLGEY